MCIRDSFLANSGNQTAIHVPSAPDASTPQHLDTSTPRHISHLGARPKTRQSVGLPPLAPQGDVNPQEENLRRLQDQQRDKQASMEYLAQQIELKQKEVEERRREKMIAKRKKAEEKRREEEEKRRVDDLIQEQQQKEKAINDAIMNQL